MMTTLIVCYWILATLHNAAVERSYTVAGVLRGTREREILIRVGSHLIAFLLLMWFGPTWLWWVALFVLFGLFARSVNLIRTQRKRG